MRKLFIVLMAVSMLTAVAMADFDMGDLPPCNYPTLYGNPAHTLSGKAWLGQCITYEEDPWPVNTDPCDDGVIYLSLPWTPCEVETVLVIVTPGQNYTGNPLWLNGWKDGNLDGDFCDTLCDGADEWIVQNVPVAPGVHQFTFVDPGVVDIGVYDGVFRWRLTGRSTGRNSFGFYDPWQCPDSPFCGNFGADSLGEVEDYVISDAQLDVNLISFEAIPGDEQVTLEWSTASETNNDRFEIVRDGGMVAQITAINRVTGSTYSWTDQAVQNGMIYVYKLVSVDLNGTREELAIEQVTPNFEHATVTEYALHQNYPNPFNPETNISFDLVENTKVTLNVFNPLGQQVATLVNRNMSAGRHTVSFDASNLPSGLYVYRLETANFTSQKKMILMK